MPSPQKRTRTDNSLNTGMSSVAERRSQQRLEEQQRKRAGVREALLPSAEIMLEWIDKDIKKIDSIESKVFNVNLEELRGMVPLASRLNVSDKDLLVAQLLAQAMHIEWLRGTKNRIKVTLRQAKSADKKWYSTQDAPEAWVEAAEDVK